MMYCYINSYVFYKQKFIAPISLYVNGTIHKYISFYFYIPPQKFYSL